MPNPDRLGSPVSGDACPPPSWVGAWLGNGTPQSSSPRVSVTRGQAATLVTGVAARMRTDSAEIFAGRTKELYDEMYLAAQGTEHRRIVRMWNHIPGIHDPMDDGWKRYMAFNGGRYRAMYNWFGDTLGRQAPAASGVGNDTTSLVVHALSVASGGTRVDNPLQAQAYLYSQKYGPLPPCFARAIRLEHPTSTLLISGTASIAGESSMHNDSLDKQFALTLENLRRVVQAAGESGDALDRIEHVRAYVPPETDRAWVAAAMHDAFSGQIELISADLCRPELLIEIEGVATLP